MPLLAEGRCASPASWRSELRHVMGNCIGIQSLKNASCVSEIVKVMIIPARVNTQAPERWKGKWTLPPCQQPPVASTPPRGKLLRHFLVLPAGSSPCPRDGAHSFSALLRSASAPFRTHLPGPGVGSTFRRRPGLF